MKLLTTLGFTGAYFFDHRRIPEVVITSNESRADLAVSAIIKTTVRIGSQKKGL